MASERSRKKQHKALLVPEPAKSGIPGEGLPLVFIVLLGAAALLPRIQANRTLFASFLGAAVVLLLWWLALLKSTRSSGRKLSFVFVPRPQHYVQALAHTSILVYWAFYWKSLWDAGILIAAQIVFAYAFDMLLTWSRRDTYTLGFVAFPIIYSTNLFLRFRDDWFYLQFLMVAVGFLAKEFIHWKRDGRSTHVFNPSSFPLAVFSLGLILTQATPLTWGEDIASLLILPPQIYLFIFLVALPGQFLFRVTSMTLPAVLTTYLFSVFYLKMTGTYFFFDSHVPIAVFLGMHLLFTDPSTSPRTELGRIFFGMIYGLTVVGLYVVLGWFGAPTFYDKLLQVPLMNLMVRRLDLVAKSDALAWLNPERLGRALAPQLRSLVYVSLWLGIFAVMTWSNGVGDYHPGHTIPFWEQACKEDRKDACLNLATLEWGYCRQSSGWACNEMGILVATGKVNALPPAPELFDMACKAGMTAGCDNAKAITEGAKFRHADPDLKDYLLVLRQGKGPIPDDTPLEIATRACDQGWAAGCGTLGVLYLQGDNVTQDPMRAASLLEGACDSGHAPSCSNAAFLYKQGQGVPLDNVKALDYLGKACSLGMQNACGWLEQEQKRSIAPPR